MRHQLVLRGMIVWRRSLAARVACRLSAVTAKSMNVQGLAPALQAAAAPATALVTSGIVSCGNVSG